MFCIDAGNEVTFSWHQEIKIQMKKKTGPDICMEMLKSITTNSADELIQ